MSIQQHGSFHYNPKRKGQFLWSRTYQFSKNNFLSTSFSMELFFCAKYDVTLTSELSETSQNLTQHFRKIQESCSLTFHYISLT